MYQEDAWLRIHRFLRCVVDSSLKLILSWTKKTAGGSSSSKKQQQQQIAAAASSDSRVQDEKDAAVATSKGLQQQEV